MVDRRGPGGPSIVARIEAVSADRPITRSGARTARSAPRHLRLFRGQPRGSGPSGSATGSTVSTTVERACGGARGVYTTSLRPYRFRVMAQQRGRLERRGATVGVDIAPQVWQTRWFRLTGARGRAGPAGLIACGSPPDAPAQRPVRRGWPSDTHRPGAARHAAAGFLSASMQPTAVDRMPERRRSAGAWRACSRWSVA